MTQCVKCKRNPGWVSFCCWCGRRQQDTQKKSLKRANGTGTVYKLQGRRKRPWVAAKSGVIVGYYDKKTSALEALARLQGRSLDEYITGHLKKSMKLGRMNTFAILEQKEPKPTKGPMIFLSRCMKGSSGSFEPPTIRR